MQRPNLNSTHVISPLSYLRLRRLAFELNRESINTEYLNNRTEEFHRHLSPRNKKLVLSQWKVDSNTLNVEVKISVNSGQCICDGRIKFIKPSSLSMKILDYFVAKKVVETQEFVRNVLGKHELNEYSYDVAKKAVTLVNLRMFELTGIEKTLYLNRFSVVLNAKIQIILC